MPVTSDRRDPKEMSANEDLREPRAKLGRRVRKAKPATLALEDRRASRVRPALLAQPGHKAQKAIRATQAQQGPKVQRAIPAILVRKA